MKLSIITINYNNFDGLQKTIDSVLCQTWRDFEWIVIDGGSTDGSKELIEEYQDHFAYWCSESDKGVYNAMNKGIAKAKGEYLNFMNSGDCFYDKDSLLAFDKCCCPSIDVFYGDADFYDGQGNLFLKMKLPEKIDAGFYMSGNNISHQASFIKTPLLKDRLYDESYKLASDGDFFFWLLLRKYKFKHIDKTIVRSDIPGLSADRDQSQKESERFKKENLQNLPFQYKVSYQISTWVKRCKLKFCNIFERL